MWFFLVKRTFGIDFDIVKFIGDSQSEGLSPIFFQILKPFGSVLTNWVQFHVHITCSPMLETIYLLLGIKLDSKFQPFT